MSAFKQFLSKDIKLVPFTVNKQFSFDNSEFYADESEFQTYKQFVGIERFLGTNLSGSLFETATDPTTGNSQSLYQRQVYDSVKELYYSNYISSSWGDPGTAIQRESISGSFNTPSYYNYLSSTLTASRYFPTASNSQVSVVSIPSKLFGEYIQPKSFEFILQDSSNNRLQILDDGEGNLYSADAYTSTPAFGSVSVVEGENVGNIIYEHGIAVITNPNTPIVDITSNSNVTSSFSSTTTIMESEYKCVIRENEFNFSLNPSLTSGSVSIQSPIGTFNSAGEILYPYATGSYFSPYITTVGLYDDLQNLIAIGKLAQPLQSSPTTDTTIIVNIDF